MKEITLKVKDIKEYITEQLGPILKNDGFDYKKTYNEYVCKKGDYTYIFIPMLTAWSTSYEVNLELFISQKQIEDIQEKILGKQRHRLTIGEHMLERIYYSPDGRKIEKGNSLSIWMAENNDVYAAAERLKEYYYKIAKPYFNLFCSLEAFDDYMNKPPFDYSPAYVGSFTNSRCMKGLIVAKLVNNPNYAALVDTYDELIKRTLSDVQPDSITNYDKVKEYLKDNF